MINFNFKFIIKFFIITIFAVMFLIVMINQMISWRSNKYIYDQIDEIPAKKAALVLGTSKYRRDGSANKYFYNRIEAVVELYKNNKINFIIVSGDNKSIYYNEPRFMRMELLKHGVPDNVIYLDYAGFRTFDSVIRCHKVFGQNEFIVVSQKFHNQRAVFIARSRNIEAIAYNAEDLSVKEGFRVKMREVFARIKVCIDLITGQQPKFLGEPIKVGIY